MGLGVGFDLPWGRPVGFQYETNQVGENTQKFLQRYQHFFHYLMYSFQPKGMCQLEVETYLPAYQNLISLMPRDTPVVFHQTTLNLGSLTPYDRTNVFSFTNSVASVLNVVWVVEDIGIWSMNGLPMPYPLPTPMTNSTVPLISGAICTAAESLQSPLSVEFPGFTDGASIILGDLDAYDWFRLVTADTGAQVTLDVAHLLSWRWLRGFRQNDLYADLDHLPLELVRDLHLSGSAIAKGRFLDLHHGVLLDEQLRMTERLMELCPNLSGITYEDPKYVRDGEIFPPAEKNFLRLVELVDEWMN